jgi:hypothetical protein
MYKGIEKDFKYGIKKERKRTCRIKETRKQEKYLVSICKKYTI